MTEEKWKKIELSTWNGKGDDGKFSLKEDDELVGIYLDTTKGVGEFEANLYAFKTTEGEVISVWGGTVLDTRLKNLEAGEEVRIVYLGDVQGGGGKPYHNYDVFHRKAEMKKVEAKDPGPEEE